LKKTRVEYEPHLNQPHSIRFRKILRSAQIHEEIEGLEREKERKLAKTSAEPYLKWKREKKREDKLRQRSSSGYLGEPGSNQRSRGGTLAWLWLRTLKLSSSLLLIVGASTPRTIHSHKHCNI